MNLECLVVPEVKEVLKDQKDGYMSKGCRSQPERTPDSKCWNNLRKIKNDNIVLDFNPKYKIKAVSESRLIQRNDCLNK